jgi:hypothetical protein
MHKKYWIYLILLVVGVAILLLLSTEKTSTLNSDATFAIADTAAIDKVFIADRSGNTITLDRQENYWMINNKYIVRKDAINILLSTIHQLKIERPVPLNTFENVVKNLSTTGVKVEIYSASKTLRVYTVGAETADHLGTYMLLDGAAAPFIMHIPAFNGYLSPRYGIQGQLIDEKNWRKRTVFNVPSDSIQNITVCNLLKPHQSFSLQLFPTLLVDYAANPIAFNEQAVLAYINNFRQLNCESYKKDKSKIEFATPLHELIVNTDTLRTFAIGDSILKRKEDNFTVERMHATLNNGELMLIQNYVFNKVLITIDELRK